MTTPFVHVIGFDDFAFERKERGSVPIVGTVYSGHRLDGILRSEITRDGDDSARVIEELVRGSRFYEHTQAILLQGIAMAGFNVVDIHALHQALALPVLVVARKAPNMERIERALKDHVVDGHTKWGLIEKAGPMEAVAGVFVQRAGLTLAEAEATVDRLTVHSVVPEPLRVAHIVASGISNGETRGRV